MKSEDVERNLRGVDPPMPGRPAHQDELKIPLLSYRRSSRAGLWLLIMPVVVAITYVLRYELGMSSVLLNAIGHSLAAVDRNPVLTFLIPILFIGLPSAAMFMNLLAFAHFSRARERQELLITLKYRPLNIGIFLFSFAVLVFFLLPDRLSF